MPKRKKTKIVATLGPATSTKEILKGMLEEGVNVFRINFSHADYEAVKERIEMIRDLNEEFGYNAAILADLQGPKLLDRFDRFVGGKCIHLVFLFLILLQFIYNFFYLTNC